MDGRHERAKSLVQELPPSVRVAGFDIAIEQWHDLSAQASKRWGEFSACEQRIRIQIGMPTPAKAVDTVLHEIGHAIFWAYGLEDGDKEERVVSTFATAWTQVYRNNPALLAWLTEALS